MLFVSQAISIFALIQLRKTFHALTGRFLAVVLLLPPEGAVAEVLSLGGSFRATPAEPDPLVVDAVASSPFIISDTFMVGFG